MHCPLLRYRRTTGGVLRLFGLAVLFLFFLDLFLFSLPSTIQAVGLEIKLYERDRRLVRFGDQFPQLGLSISCDSLPLLKTKLNIIQSILVDYEDGFVAISEKQGFYELYKPIFLTLPTYTSTTNRLQFQQDWRTNLNRHFLGGAPGSSGLFEWEIPVKFPRMVSKIVGEGGPSLKVQGYRMISFSGRSMWEDDIKNTATSRQSKFPSLHMEQQSAFKITGTIGSKISVEVDQDSRRHTDLQNTLKLRYKGEEDEIIQTIEAGNTNLSVSSGAVGYGENKQGLFGIKATAKIGGWDLTMITSQDKGSTEKADFKAGAETSAEPIRDYQYLQRVFYDLGYLEDFTEGDSISEIKLFKSNKQISSSTAQNPAPYGIAYIDPKHPSDSINFKYEEPFHRRFEEIDPNEYFIQRMRQTTQEGNLYPYVQFFNALEKADILGVFYVLWKPSVQTFETTGLLKDSCTTAEQETCMVLKLLKSDDPRPTDYTWDYEWKNVYSLGGRNIQREGFSLDIYKSSEGAEDIEQNPNYQDSTSYLRVLGLDELDLNAEPNPDGIIDYRQIDFGLGYLIFPDRHPFAPKDTNRTFTGNPGDKLKERVDKIYNWGTEGEPKENSTYYIWVESASRKAQYLLGRAPIIEGSEVVILNERTLVRDQDYTIQYEIGEITFINPEANNPNADLSVNYEYAPLLMIEKKSMFGMMTQYNLGNNLKFGTIGIYKSEKTADERPRVGQEPRRNFIWGSNLDFSSDTPFLTNMLNGIPWIQTETPSSMTFHGELAQSIPNPNTKDQAFIDDFEGSLEYTDLSIRRGTWTLCSSPLDRQPSDRCKMWWYNPYDQILVSDIWPNKETERNEERTNILQLQFFPKQPHRPSNTSFDSTSIESNWNGIIRSLYTGAYEQSRARFLELWVHADKGVIHIDLGEISEDLDDDRLLSTEDKPRNGQRDGILEDTEDLGLDTLDNNQEKEFYACPECDDPAGDDWNYDNRYDYSRINGTQGNREDPDRGRRPDTEDINLNSVLDLTNKYFHFSLDLSKDEFLTTRNEKGWKLYRIPLNDPLNYDKEGDPDWGNIRFARLWVTSDENCTIQIASIQLVGNRWQNLGISSVTNRQTPLPVGTTPNEEFEVFVKNTHEDPDYYSPPGIAGTLNRQTNVREKEQSLVLKFSNLKPNHQGVAYRILPKTEDYTGYRYLEMFVHGPEDQSLQADLQFYMRLGSDSSNFYEYLTTVHPAWNDSNKIKMDFDQITGLKAYAMNDTTNQVGRLDVKEGHYRVKGNPSINRIKWFSLGVVNTQGAPVSGEIWADELQVTGIRKEKGISGNMKITTKFADLASMSFSFKKQDSQYRSLTQTKENTQSNTSYSLSLSGIQVHRFIPVSLGYSLPVSTSYSYNLNLPKWKSGSDIVLPKELRDKEKSESVTKNINLTPRFDHPTQNWLVGATLKKMTHSFSYGTSHSTSFQSPIQNSNTATLTGGYTFPLTTRGLSIKPFGWLKGALLPGSFTQMSFSLLPDNVSVSGNLNRSKRYSVDRVGNVSDIYTRSFSGNLNASASPIKAIPLRYTMNTSRDLRDPNTIKYSFNPKDAKLGIETSYGETFTTDYTPSWLSFLNAKFNFNSSYTENADKLDQNNVGGTRKVSNKNEKKASFTLDWKKILGVGAPKQGEKKKSSLFNPLNLLRMFTGRFDPIGVSWHKGQDFSKSGLLARPTLSYRLGFSVNPRVERKGLIQSTDRERISEGYSARSGVKLLGTNISLNYARNENRTITASEDTKNTSTRFPDFGFSLSKLGTLGFIKRFFTPSACNVTYFKQVDENANEKTGEKLTRRTSENFSPLASFSLTWKNGIVTNVKIDKKIFTDENLKRTAGNQSIAKSYDNSINVSNNYSFSAPSGIKIPFLRKIRFRSTLSLSLSVSKSSRKTKSSVAGQPFNVTADNSRLSISSTASYTFSSQVTGGFSAKWGDTNDKITKRKTHSRELGIWIKINF